MDTPQNPVAPIKDQKIIYKFIAFLALGLVVGSVISYLVTKQETGRLQKQITTLQNDLITLRVTPTPNLEKTSRTLYSYGVTIAVPKNLGEPAGNESVIPLGATGSYSVKSYLNTFDTSPNIRILFSTDSIVYENFIRNGTLAITPDPNTLTPGAPNAINGLNFCSKLGAKVCTYDEDTNTATFEKEYKPIAGDAHTVTGAAHFFNVQNNKIGNGASVVITRVVSNNLELIQVAKDIALSAKN